VSLKEFVSSLNRKEVEDYSNYELDPVLEPTRMLYLADRNEKVMLFRVRGAQQFLCVGNVLNSRRRLYEKLLNARSDEEAYKRLLEAVAKPTKPREVDFSTNFKSVRDFDLHSMPFIKFYGNDGGRYLTSSIFIACLDSVCNASIHRTMLISKDTVVARIVPRHLRYIYDEYRRRGSDTPVAIVVGVHPAVELMAAMSPPFGVFELNLVPNILGNFAITYTPKYSIPVPAIASVVLEGRISSSQFIEEGPFVDLLNLYDGVRKEPLIKIEAVYVNPEEYFYVILPAGKEHKLLQSFYREALVWQYVSNVVPRVHKVRMLEPAGSWLVVVVSITKNVDGDAKNAIIAAFSAHPSAKIVLVLDEDVDLDSLDNILWAFATRFRGKEGVVIIEKSRCSTLDPISPTGVCDKMGIDLTVPISMDRESFKYVRVQ
jgi:UbiD family decarboxylase